MHPMESVADVILPPPQHRGLMRNVAALQAFAERADFRMRVGNDLGKAAEMFLQSGEKLAVLADPAIHGPAHDSTLTVMLMSNGAPVGCTTIRRIWVDDLAWDMKTLRYWYGWKASEASAAGVRCIVPDAQWLGEIRNCWTIWSCAFHVGSEAQRVRGLTEALIRIGHALALAKWEWRWLLGRGKTGIAARFPFDIYGVNHVSPGLFLLQADEQPGPDHPHYLMGSGRLSFAAQASHAYYGDPLQKIGIPPALRPKAEEA